MVTTDHEYGCYPNSSCKDGEWKGAKRTIRATGKEAETFYDTQQFQYGVRGKWGYSFYNPQEDKAHHIYAIRLDTKTYIKPWEQAGHPHDFYRASRSTRSNDPEQHYEHGKALQRHERLVAEVDAWRRRELLKEDLTFQMSKLRAIEHQRVHFQELRRHIHLEQLKWSRPFTAKVSSEHSSQNGSIDRDQIQPNSTRSFMKGRRSSSRCSIESCGSRPSTAPPSQPAGGGHIAPIRIINPKSNATAKLEVQELDTFDERLERMQPKPVLKQIRPKK